MYRTLCTVAHSLIPRALRFFVWEMLGSDADASYLDEIQVIELLVLVPALSVRAPSSVCAHASPRAYDPALSQLPAGPHCLARTPFLKNMHSIV